MNARTDWLEARKTGVGGSEIAAILGLSQWRTPYEVYLDKRGEAPPQPDNDAMLWGRLLEPVVRQRYADVTGSEVRMYDGLVRHPKHDWMIANLDGFTTEPRVYEGKTARSGDGWGEPGSSDIPQPYLLQSQWYMEVSGFALADVAVLIGGSDFRIYTVEADRELQQMLIDAGAEFWARVQRGEPPEPVSLAEVQARYGRASRAEQAYATPDVVDALATVYATRRGIAELESQEEAARATVLKFLGERDTLVGGNGAVLATWRASKPAMRLDGAALRAAHPDIAAQFTKPSEPSRRLLLAKEKS